VLLLPTPRNHGQQRVVVDLAKVISWNFLYHFEAFGDFVIAEQYCDAFAKLMGEAALHTAL
jgi:hypothetical protein